jgi:hypothetical protein
MNSNQYQEIIFPSDTDLIISKLLAKYGLKETFKDLAQKLSKGETTIGGEVAKLIKEVAENKISAENLALSLEQRLNIPKKVAVQLADDIKKEILNFVEKVSLKKEEILKRGGPPKKTEEEIEIPPEKLLPQKKDIYREPIE